MTTRILTMNATEALIARRVDFPTWMPAVLVKELRQGLRERSFVGALVGFQVIMTLFLVFAIAGGSGSGAYNLLQGAFWIMLSAQLLVITPLRGLTGLQSEVDSRWVDLLMLTRLTAWRVVTGKWVSLLVQAALLVIAMLPYGVARYFFGSVDLVAEAKMIAVMFAVSGVLTAGALWASVLPKIARVAVVIAGVCFSPMLEEPFEALMSMGRRPMRSAGLSGIGSEAWLAVYDAMLLVGFCLIGAVRRLAPRAESQTPLSRLLPLLAFIPAPWLGRGMIELQLVMGGIFVVFVAALELARSEEPMDCHWRAWSRRGWLGRMVGRFVQPGWASGIEWVMLIAAAVALGGLFSPQPWRVALGALLGAEALIFPVLMLTWMSRQFSQRAAGYALVLLGASLLAAAATAASVVTRNYTWADRVMYFLPISSFWSMLRVNTPLPPAVMLPQILIAGVVIGGAWLRASKYRAQRKVFDQQPLDDLPT